MRLLYDSMACLSLLFVLTLTAAVSMPTASLANGPNYTDSPLQFSCDWVKAENSNVLVVSGHCRGAPTVTGGTSTKIVQDGCETFEVTRGRNEPTTVREVAGPKGIGYASN